MVPAMNEQWLDLLPEVAGALSEKSGEHERIWEWSLVLSAMDIEHVVRGKGRPRELLVKERDASRAMEEILLYERENSGHEPPAALKEGTGGFEPTLWSFLALAAFFKIVRLDLHILGYHPVPWQEIGSVEAWAVLHGEWWRTVTGLTLHGNFPHILSNILVGSVFIIIICRELGSGAGWFLVLLSGALGNLCNVLVQGPPHDSLGFSTAVFGSVGIIAGLRSVETQASQGPRRFLPLAAALGLLALLGTGGENTDLGAHFLGLAGGFPLGLVASGFKGDQLQPGSGMNAWLGSAAALLVAGTWGCALVSSSPVFK